MSDGLLRIGLRPGIHHAHDATLEAEVTAPGIERVLAAGASTVRIAPTIESERLDIALSGSSTITADLALGVGHVALSGSSMATLAGVASTVEATVSGANSATSGPRASFRGSVTMGRARVGSRSTPGSCG